MNNSVKEMYFLQDCVLEMSICVKTALMMDVKRINAPFDKTRFTK